MIKYCQDRLANYKLPKVVEFVESLPKTSTGKILKRALK
ncbi:MAG: AMP-binding enzyme [Eubacteriales bacterium]